jgi:hypothetical protein
MNTASPSGPAGELGRWRTCRMSIEYDIVERVKRAASKKQIPISDTMQNDQNRF